ncbi:hypothetical protein [Spirosoma fluviale]|uniref:Uncharacterized protein n=1 Tax=Spirosoma fluviale TaxID=1597977 RepID=A0A286FCR4_9BACT|nr:hypothetical protein [Spirosoma fluviale]SOD81031.1 hypothetical protein SAMN06269250_1651 [Spirosoma fluviale]
MSLHIQVFKMLFVGLFFMAGSISADAVGEWLADRVINGVVILCILVGSIYASVNSDSNKTLSLTKRYVSQFTSVFLMGLISGYLIDTLQWNPYVFCILGLALGIGSDFCLRWILAWFQNSDGFVTLFTRISEVARAAYSAWNSVNNKP